jgi:hypothetical protein
MDAFGGSDGKFSVPCLSDFIKGVAENGVVEHLDWNSPYKKHSHEINFNLEDKEFSESFSISSYGYGRGTDFHGCKTREFKYWTTFALDVTLTIDQGVELGPHGNEVEETHPSFNYMPVMIYIGGASQ